MALWLGAVAGGFSILGRFEATPGAAALSVEQWPKAAPFSRNLSGPTLLVFAHPRCPCTAATIGELNRLLARAEGRARTFVLFYSDPAVSHDWLDSPSYRAAAALPGVTVLADERGSLARLFGARTSGQVLLYGQDARLRFDGGITPARGHAGDSSGSEVVRSLLYGQDGAAQAPVYGCSLLSPAESSP